MKSTLPHLRRQGISLGVDLFELDGSFKAKVLEEAKKVDPLPDLKLMVREYIDGIRKLHSFIRDSINTVVTNADDELDKTLKAYKALDSDQSDAGVAVIRMNEPPTFEVMFYLFSERIEYRNALVRRNHVAGEFAKSYISSEVLPGK